MKRFVIGDEEYTEEVNTAYDQDQDIGDSPQAYYSVGAEPINAKNGEDFYSIQTGGNKEGLGEFKSVWKQLGYEAIEGNYDVFDYNGKLIASNISRYEAGEYTGDYIIRDSNGEDVSRAFIVSLNHIGNEKFKSRDQQQWYYATDQDFLDDEPHEARKVEEKILYYVCEDCGQQFIHTISGSERFIKHKMNKHNLTERDAFGSVEYQDMAFDEGYEGRPSYEEDARAVWNSLGYDIKKTILHNNGIYEMKLSNGITLNIDDIASDREWEDLSYEIQSKLKKEVANFNWSNYSGEKLNKDGTGTARAIRGLDPKNKKNQVMKFDYVSKAGCDICAQYDGKTFSRDSPNRPIIPRLESQGKSGSRPYTHPNCKCRWTKVFNEVKHNETMIMNPKFIERARSLADDPDEFDKLSNIQRNMIIIKMLRKDLGMEGITDPISLASMASMTFSAIKSNKATEADSPYKIQPMLDAIVDKALGREEKKEIEEEVSGEFTLDNLLRLVADKLAKKLGKKLGLESKVKGNEVEPYGTVKNYYIMKNDKIIYVMHTGDYDVVWNYSQSVGGDAVHDDWWFEKTGTQKKFSDGSIGESYNKHKLANKTTKKLGLESHGSIKCVCGRTFDFNTELDEHINFEYNDHHGMNHYKANESYNKHKCPQCHEEFNTNDEVIIHMIEEDHGDNFGDIEDSVHTESYASEGGCSNCWGSGKIDDEICSDCNGTGSEHGWADEGGRGSGKKEHRPWMLGAELSDVCKRCMVSTEWQGSVCTMCGIDSKANESYTDYKSKLLATDIWRMSDDELRSMLKELEDLQSYTRDIGNGDPKLEEFIEDVKYQLKYQ